MSADRAGRRIFAVAKQNHDERPTTLSRKRPARRPQGKPGQGRPAQGRPVQGRPQQGGARPAIQRRSLTPLLYLRQLPGWAAPLVMAALLIVGLAVRGWGGAIALCLVAIFITWLGYLSWPALSILARAGRLLVTAFVLALAFLQSTR
jgi:hypothetical protein